MQASYVQPRAKTLRLAKQSGKGRVSLYMGENTAIVTGTCWWTSVTENGDKWLDIMASPRNVGIESQNNSTSTWKTPGTPNFMPNFKVHDMSNKRIELYTQYCALIAFVLQTSRKKNPFYNLSDRNSMFISVFSTEHKRVNINVYTKYWLQQNTKHFLYLSETEYTKQFFPKYFHRQRIKNDFNYTHMVTILP